MLPSAIGYQNHDRTKRANPAYSFGTRSGADSKYFIY